MLLSMIRLIPDNADATVDKFIVVSELILRTSMIYGIFCKQNRDTPIEPLKFCRGGGGCDDDSTSISDYGKRA